MNVQDYKATPYKFEITGHALIQSILPRCKLFFQSLKEARSLSSLFTI